MTRSIPSEHYRLLMSLRQSDEDVCLYPGETANWETLSPEVGRLQIALVAARRVIPISAQRLLKRRMTGNGSEGDSRRAQIASSFDPSNVTFGALYAAGGILIVLSVSTLGVSRLSSFRRLRADRAVRRCRVVRSEPATRNRPAPVVARGDRDDRHAGLARTRVDGLRDRVCLYYLDVPDSAPYRPFAGAEILRFAERFPARCHHYPRRLDLPGRPARSGGLRAGSMSMCRKRFRGASTRTPGHAGASGDGHSEDANGRNALLDEASSKGSHRDGAARPDLQSHPRHEQPRKM